MLLFKQITLDALLELQKLTPLESQTFLGPFHWLVELAARHRTFQI